MPQNPAAISIGRRGAGTPSMRDPASRASADGFSMRTSLGERWQMMQRRFNSLNERLAVSCVMPRWSAISRRVSGR